MIDLILLAILALVTWRVAEEGAWGAGSTFVAVIVSGLIAMNFFEPAAEFLSHNALTSSDWQNRWDVMALLGIFAGCVFGMRMLAESVFPTFPDVAPLIYQLGRWGFGLATGYVVMAILLTAVHVAPLPRDFLGFTPERGNFFQMAPDRQWLGFTQFVSETSMQARRADGTIAVFDGPRYPSNPDQPESTQVWSDFPMRYAARREQHSTGAAPSTGVPEPPSSRPAQSGPRRSQPAGEDF